MAKKIKKRPNQSREVEDPNLESVDEDRAFEVWLDEETEEIVNVHHYRRKFGDEFEADIEHALNLDEAKQYVMCLLGFIESLEKLRLKSDKVEEKQLPELVEGNPAQGSKKLEE